MSAPKRTTKDSTPTFRFSATEAGSSFQCRWDTKAWHACTSKWTSSRLAKGKHTFAVRATDHWGNRDATPATFKFRIK
jgi:hypothetical protein